MGCAGRFPIPTKRASIHKTLRASMMADHSRYGIQRIPIMKDGDISLRHLKALSLLLEVRSLTKAAEILEVNQPTVSKMLVRLRAHFGDPLFVRVGLSMQPTPRALD